MPIYKTELDLTENIIGRKIMEKLIAILSERFPEIDFNKEKTLVDSGLLDSVDVVNIIADIEEKFGIEVSMEYIDSENFNSIENIWKTLEEIKNEQ